MNETQIAALAIVYGFCSLVAFIAWMHGEVESEAIIWWPIVLFKFLLRSLWRVLTTGWKP